jgi:uncharacterized protein YjbI with pentapeptide repeats
MTNEKLIKIIKSNNYKLWNRYINKTKRKDIVFKRETFIEININKFNFNSCKFYSCKFYSCKFDSCKFNFCNFDYCNFDSCKFNFCNFDSCNFDSCKFNSCSLPNSFIGSINLELWCGLKKIKSADCLIIQMMAHIASFEADDIEINKFIHSKKFINIAKKFKYFKDLN